MQREIKCVIILPDTYSQKTTESFPVMYLLHGYGNNYKIWIEKKPSLPRLASSHNMIVVCPDGEASWYWDSPINPSSQFETFLSKELVEYIDKNYRTIANRKGRAITGLSMGGHGAMWTAIRHQDIFGAVGSMSGGLDIRPFPGYWKMNKQIGEYKDNTERWNQYTVITQLDKLTNNSLAIFIDCGVGDFFLQVNKDAHNMLLQKGINHDFILRPGGHDWDYWTNAVEYHMLFFKNYFQGKHPLVK